jgi:chemotaxis protein methyltransferase CheR
MIALTDSEFLEISNYIRKYYGVNLEKKRLLIEGRLGFYIHSLGFTSYREYFEYIKNDPTHQELANLLNRLTTNHTYFMREESHFEFYLKRVLPWVDEELHERDLRVWSAGCSSGQEPYTLAIITLNYLASKPHTWDSVILASDISERALCVARNGVYPKEELNALPTQWRNKWFEKCDDKSMRVTDELRANVAFKRANLMNPFQIKKPFHCIFCRNVMIYFDNATKETLMKKIYDALLPGGYFLIGHSESLSAIENRFTYISPSVYRKPLNP